MVPRTLDWTSMDARRTCMPCCWNVDSITCPRNPTPIFSFWSGHWAQGPLFRRPLPQKHGTTAAALDPAVSGALRDFLEHFPAADLRVESEWAGILGFTRDGHPLVGRLPCTLTEGSSVFIGAGFCGHGMPYCFSVGRHLVELIAGAELSDPYLCKHTPDRIVTSSPPTAPDC